MAHHSTLPLGIVSHMAADKYHADPGVSNSMLKALSKSPAHCFALYLAENRPAIGPTEAQFAGTVAHTLILEPDQVEQRYVVKPDDVDYRTKAGRAWRDEQTRQIITADELETAHAQRAAVLRVPELATLLRGGMHEASVFWNDGSTRLRCRARPDCLRYSTSTRVTVLDIKTIAELTRDGIERAIGAYAYHRQQAHYSNGLRANGLQVDEFVFGFVSSSYPFLAAPFLLDEESLQQGTEEVDELLSQFLECAREGQWPVFGDGYQLSGLPAYKRRSRELEVSYVD